MNTRPAVAVTLFYILGLIIGYYFPYPLRSWWGFLWFFWIFVWFCYRFYSRHPASAIAFSFLTILFGYARVQTEYDWDNDRHIRNELGRSQLIAGVVKSFPIHKNKQQQFYLDIFAVAGPEQIKISEGRCAVILRSSQQLDWGDTLVFSGTLQPLSGGRNPGEFDYRKYSIAKGIWASARIDSTNILQIKPYPGWNFYRKIIYPLREYAKALFDRQIGGNEAGILIGLIVGDRDLIPSEITTAFINTGVVHILAVSGLHVAFVLIILLGTLSLFRLPYWMQVVVTIGGLIFYTVFTGNQAPVLRATIMGVVYLIGTLMERRTDFYNILAFSALVILLFRPFDLFDAGFQLSFCAVLSTVYFGRIMKPWFQSLTVRWRENRFKNFIEEYIFNALLVTTAAQIGTIPLTAYYFNKVPVISFVANLVIVPLSGIIVGLGFVQLFLVRLSETVSGIYAHANQALIQWMIRLVTLGSDQSFSYFYIRTPNGTEIFIYFLLVVAIFNWSKSNLRNKLLIAALLIANFIVWKPLPAPGEKVKITFLDVGQGDASLIEFPNQKTMLIDGGDKGFGGDLGEKVVTPFLIRQGITELTYVVMSHPHNDHIGGLLQVLKNIKVDTLMDSGENYDSRIYRDILQMAKGKSIPILHPRAGDIFTIRSDCRIFVLHPTKYFFTTENEDRFGTNNSSIVFKLVYRDNTALFMGDAENETDYYLERFGKELHSDIIKVGHHGSQTSSDSSILSLVRPEYAVISVGVHNKFHHPSSLVINRLHHFTSNVLRTDQLGAIQFELDGANVTRVR